MSIPIRIATRGSQLALWQANHIAAELRAHGQSVEVEVIRTTGDRMQDPAFQPPASFEDGTPLDAKGVFTKELEDALLARRVDVAVHSLKDLPTGLDPRFLLAAIPPRADARDVLVCEEYWGLHMLPEGARLATTSPRRKAMLLALRPDLQFVEMRGNIDTRLRKWQAGEAHGLVLAAAGLDRLGRTEHVHQRFAIDEVTPAPGQGALALETLAHAPAAVTDALCKLHDPAAAFATEAERHVLAAMGGGCMLPLGAYCHQVDDHWHLHAMVAAPDGEQSAHVLCKAAFGTPAADLGQTAAEELIGRGAREIIQAETKLLSDHVAK